VNFADAAPSPEVLSWGAVICGGLSCMFVVSAIALVVVLVRRSQRKKSPPAA
jgi:hypothetical protein